MKRGMIIRLTKDEVSDIRRMKTKGKTFREIQEWIGCSKAAISYHTKDLRRKHKWTEEERKKAMEPETRWGSLKKVAAEIGVSTSAVATLRRDMKKMERKA